MFADLQNHDWVPEDMNLDQMNMRFAQRREDIQAGKGIRFHSNAEQYPFRDGDIRQTYFPHLFPHPDDAHALRPQLTEEEQEYMLGDLEMPLDQEIKKGYQRHLRKSAPHAYWIAHLSFCLLFLVPILRSLIIFSEQFAEYLAVQTGVENMLYPYLALFTGLILGVISFIWLIRLGKRANLLKPLVKWVVYIALGTFVLSILVACIILGNHSMDWFAETLSFKVCAFIFIACSIYVYHIAPHPIPKEYQEEHDFQSKIGG